MPCDSKVDVLRRVAIILRTTGPYLNTHYSEVMMGAMTTQITSLTVVCSTVCWSKKTSKLRVTGLCAGYSPVTGECPAQMASNAENVSFWWRHHEDGLSSYEIPYDRLIVIMGRPTPVRRHFDIEKAAYSSHIIIKHALQHSVYALADNLSSHCSDRKVYYVIVYCNKTFVCVFWDTSVVSIYSKRNTYTSLQQYITSRINIWKNLNTLSGYKFRNTLLTRLHPSLGPVCSQIAEAIPGDLATLPWNRNQF